ncbi:MAG TPA: TraR/DksA family transcriptional regulator [Thermodesulfobacteriota bacterium]|nr:TraR/DksA family transcriptional regulator [Thermodesulfobacteriota bacterium]
MATAKSDKKKKSGRAQKPVPVPKKKKTIKRPEKKITQKKTPKKKTAGKKVKPMLKAVKPMEKPAPKGEKEEIRKTLLDMREKLLSGISESPIPEALVTQTDIGDIIDQAGDERERELSLLLSGRDKEKLHAINEALEKLEEGTYGVCEECGDKIGAGRIKVMPLAKYCVSCQAKLEKEMSLQKKAEEDLTYRGLAYPGGAEEEES